MLSPKQTRTFCGLAPCSNIGATQASATSVSRIRFMMESLVTCAVYQSVGAETVPIGNPARQNRVASKTENEDRERVRIEPEPNRRETLAKGCGELND